MDVERKKVYIYTRVSTAMQVDGYSLDAQEAKLKAYAEYNQFIVAGEYQDAGKSGKSVEGRVAFNQMIQDIKTGKDDVAFVLVFKLSRFGRNAADVLSTLQIMQDFGVNLICIEDNIDSSKDSGKLIISVLAAVAEIERENIRVQTMEGRIQKAKEGRWNGGFAPYGYSLVDGRLEINEDEAPAVRTIFEQYVTTDHGANGIAKYLETHGIRKLPRQNGKNTMFDAALIRRILENPVYCGKIAYGRRKTEKILGTRNEYHLVEQDDYILVDGLHEAIVSDEIWNEAQVKLASQSKKYEHVNKRQDEHTHLLSGIVKCPVCGTGLYGNKSIKHKPDGTKYKEFFYYGCKHRTMTHGHKCDFKKQVQEELLDDAVAELISQMVSKPSFAALLQEKINLGIDTTALDQEIEAYEGQLRKYYATKGKLAEEIDDLDPMDRHYERQKADLNDRLYKMYDKIEAQERLLIEARAKKKTIEADKITGDNIYHILTHFDNLYTHMDGAERRKLMEVLIEEVQIFPERQENGQWIKSVSLKLPMVDEAMTIGLDSYTHNDNIVTEFSDDPHLINVAVSRAKKRFILVASEEEQREGSNIGDLIGYIRYHNPKVWYGEVNSVFDYLYSPKSRLEYLIRHARISEAEYNSEDRLKYLERYKQISEYDSEILMYCVIQDELESRKDVPLGLVCHQSLQLLLGNLDGKHGITAEMKRFVNTGLSHLDFLIYNRVTKQPVLAIEVDGYTYHKAGTRRAERDQLKNQILEIYKLPLLRFATNGSGEKEKLTKELDRILAML